MASREEGFEAASTCLLFDPFVQYLAHAANGLIVVARFVKLSNFHHDGCIRARRLHCRAMLERRTHELVQI